MGPEGGYNPYNPNNPDNPNYMPDEQPRDNNPFDETTKVMGIEQRFNIMAKDQIIAIVEKVGELKEPPESISDAKDKIEDLFKELIDLRAESGDVEQIKESILETLSEFTPETIDIVKRQMNDIDYVTKAPKREAQNGYLKEEIVRMVQEDKELKNANTMGFISFDLRGLKIVNDATNNHKIGDEYLRRVVESTKDISKTVEELGVKTNIARDGGDEFSIALSSENLDLDQNVNTENIPDNLKDFIKSDEIQEMIKELSSTKTVQEEEYEAVEVTVENIRLVDVITEYYNRKLAEQKHDCIFLPEDERTEYYKLEQKAKRSATEEARFRGLEEQAKNIMHGYFENHVNTGLKEGEERTKVPAEYSLNSYVAIGGVTLSEIIENPSASDFKNVEEGFKGDGITAAERLVGTLRTRSDKKAYRHKARENQKIAQSDDKIEKFRMITMTRNEFTAEMARELATTKDALTECLNSKK